jgi:hypothetical protein
LTEELRLRISLDKADWRSKSQFCDEIGFFLEKKGLLPTIERERFETQDTGTVVSIVLGSGITTFFVQELYQWLTRRRTQPIVIEFQNGAKVTISADDDVSAKVSEIMKIVAIKS